MALEQRIESLRKRHAEIDHLIHIETMHPSTDEARLHDLKRQKLLVKDELASLATNRQRAA